MKKSRFTKEQMVVILREACRTSVAEVSKKHKVSEQSIYAWRRPIRTRLPVCSRRARCAGAQGNGLSFGAVPAHGYRRIRVFLAREGYPMSRQRAYRLWRLGKMQLPRRRPRRRVATSRPRPLPATTANNVWARDFVFDACANGQQLKCRTVIYEFARESLAIDVAGSIRAKPFIEVPAKLISVRGAQTHLRSDNGPEFASQAILEWLAAEKINTAHIDPGKSWENGADESFIGKFRDECLSIDWFRTRAEATAVIEVWRRHYNHVRPHQSLKDRTPVEIAALYHSTHQGAVLPL